jgi:hypothetical protein
LIPPAAWRVARTSCWNCSPLAAWIAGCSVPGTAKRVAAPVPAPAWAFRPARWNCGTQSYRGLARLVCAPDNCRCPSSCGRRSVLQDSLSATTRWMARYRSLSGVQLADRAGPNVLKLRP